MIRREYRTFGFCCGLGGGAKGFKKAASQVGNMIATCRCIGGIEVAAHLTTNLSQRVLLSALLRKLCSSKNVRSYFIEALCGTDPLCTLPFKFRIQTKERPAVVLFDLNLHTPYLDPNCRAKANRIGLQIRFVEPQSLVKNTRKAFAVDIHDVHHIRDTKEFLSLIIELTAYHNEFGCNASQPTRNHQPVVQLFYPIAFDSIRSLPPRHVYGDSDASHRSNCLEPCSNAILVRPHRVAGKSQYGQRQQCGPELKPSPILLQHPSALPFWGGILA
ncbi:hypothetical protein AB4Z27_28270 [Cupriavidus sp. KB_39]|uniref:hypothetical protein n=1 Tax=Cupriavidus sp. KB_39 TaxID=3233036 RepID=UPI003F914601